MNPKQQVSAIQYLDRPIQTVGQDRLNRSAFVQSLANRLVRDGKSTGLVLGLNGSWGSGKTSILNLLQDELQLRSKYNQPLVVRFEPWLISNRDDLISNFFATLTEALREKLGHFDVYNSGQDQRYDQAIGIISEYGEALSPLFNTLVPTSGIGIKALASYLKSDHEKRSSVHYKRSLVRRQLQYFEFPIVVMIDELDRIEDNEIRTMAQLLRSIGDFENISYIVAFDERRVLQSLGGGSDQESIEHGRSYLEKIIQISVQLPIINSRGIAELLRAELDELYSSFNIALSRSQKEKLDFILEGITPIPIATSRDIRKIMADYAGRVLEFSGIVDPVELFAFIVLSHKDPRSVSRIASIYVNSEYQIGFRSASQLAAFRAFGTRETVSCPSLIREGIAQWARILIERFWPDNPQRTPTLTETSSDLLAVQPALSSLLQHDARSEKPNRNQRYRIATHLNSGNFNLVRKLGSIRDQIEIGSETDEFAEAFDSVGLRRFVNYAALRGADILASGRRTSVARPENLLKIGSMLNRLHKRRNDETDDFAGTLSRILELKQIEVPAAVLAQSTILRSLSVRCHSLFPCSLPELTASNLRRLAFQEAMRSPDKCNSPVLLALWAPNIADGKFSFDDLNNWVLEKCADERFLEDLMGFVFHSPMQKPSIRASSPKHQLPMLTMAHSTIEKLIGLIEERPSYLHRFSETVQFTNLKSFRKEW